MLDVTVGASRLEKIQKGGKNEVELGLNTYYVQLKSFLGSNSKQMHLQTFKTHVSPVISVFAVVTCCPNYSIPSCLRHELSKQKKKEKKSTKIQYEAPQLSR